MERKCFVVVVVVVLVVANVAGFVVSVVMTQHIEIEPIILTFLLESEYWYVLTVNLYVGRKFSGPSVSPTNVSPLALALKSCESRSD